MQRLYDRQGTGIPRPAMSRPLYTSRTGPGNEIGTPPTSFTMRGKPLKSDLDVVVDLDVEPGLDRVDQAGRTP